MIYARPAFFCHIFYPWKKIIWNTCPVKWKLQREKHSSHSASLIISRKKVFFHYLTVREWVSYQECWKISIFVINGFGQFWVVRIVNNCYSHVTDLHYWVICKKMWKGWFTWKLFPNHIDPISERIFKFNITKKHYLKFNFVPIF